MNQFTLAAQNRRGATSPPPPLTPPPTGPSRIALNTLRSALDYFARTPIERVDINRGFLADLTAHELAEERKLTEQVLAFFVSVRGRSGQTAEFAQSFENSWTAAPGDVETAVPIN